MCTRKANKSDLDSVMSLLRECNIREERAYVSDLIRNELVTVVSSGDELLGVAALCTHAHTLYYTSLPQKIFLDIIAVSPKYRGKGIATNLIKTTCASFDTQMGAVVSNGSPANRTLIKCGFIFIGPWGNNASALSFKHIGKGG